MWKILNLQRVHYNILAYSCPLRIARANYNLTGYFKYILPHNFTYIRTAFQQGDPETSTLPLKRRLL